MAARTALTIRCIVIGYTAVQVAIWHSFYGADPWRLAGPAAAVAWAAAIVVYLRRSWPGWQVVCADSAFQVALALGLMWTVPDAMRGDTANWLFIMMAGQIVVPAWFARTRVLAPLAVASGVAYWAGAAIWPGAASGGTSPASAGYLLVTVAAVAWCAAWSLYRWATAADAALALADQDSREHYVLLSRDIERREHERLLHDTVLNTLTALARGGGGSTGVIGRCRHDVTLMEYVLSIPAETGEASAADEASEASGLDPAESARRSYGGMVAAIEAVTSEMRDRGLTVHLATAGGSPGGPGGQDGASAPAGPGSSDGASAPGTPAAVPAEPVPPMPVPMVPVPMVPVPMVPVPVAVAITHAVREALANVASHAGTGEAWVEVCPAAGGIRVTVRDVGAGFDPDHVDPTRLGLRRSIIERLADWGGQALIRSSPGGGTEVTLSWAPSPDASQNPAPGSATDLAGV